MSPDPYDVLGVPRTASEAEIRHAFWALAKRYHPDVNGGDPAASRRFVEVGNAAETLLDPRRRACYDESRVRGAPARPPAAAPKPPPPRTARAAAPKPPPPPRTARAAGTRRPASPASASQFLGDPPGGARKAVAAVLMAIIVGLVIAGALAPSPSSPRQQKRGDASTPDNGTVVWKTAGFGLQDGWGINLAGHGTRIQIVPGTSTDIEVADGDLASAGHIAVLPPGEALTYQHCVTAVHQAAGQSESLSEIGPASHSGLCVHGSGGDLAAIQVTHDDGSSLTANITVWEDV